jgi:hypothetical protein
MYYLVCGFCRWSSRDAGIPDGTSTGGPWPEPELAGGAHLDDIGDYFRMLGLREKTLKEKKYVHKSKFLAAVRFVYTFIFLFYIFSIFQEEMEQRTRITCTSLTGATWIGPFASETVPSHDA